MKYPCNLIRDILPLYHDKVASAESVVAVEEHLEVCNECRQYYNEMCAPDFNVSKVGEEQMESDVANSYKLVHKKIMKKIGKIVGVTALVVAGIILVLYLGVIAYLEKESADSCEIHRDINEYGLLEDGKNILEDDFVHRNGVEQRVWPEKITDSMNVRDYMLIYYCPWDSNYLGYLVVEYDEADYEAEVESLKAYPSTEYVGNYGATGFEDYEVLAIYTSDSCYTYALTDGEETIIYVGMIFPGYAMDIDYEAYVPEEYLPEGLDLSEDNPTRQKWIERFEETKH